MWSLTEEDIFPGWKLKVLNTKVYFTYISEFPVLYF